MKHPCGLFGLGASLAIEPQGQVRKSDLTQRRREVEPPGWRDLGFERLHERGERVQALRQQIQRLGVAMLRRVLRDMQQDGAER